MKTAKRRDPDSGFLFPELVFSFIHKMNYPGAEPTRYQMEFFISDPEGRGIKPQPSRPPKRTRRRIKKIIMKYFRLI